MLEYRATPTSQTSLGYGLLGCGAIAGLLTAIGWMVVRRRSAHPGETDRSVTG